MRNRPQTELLDGPSLLEDVAAASAAVFCDEHLPALRAATGREAFLIMQRFIAQILFAYAEALGGWGIGEESQRQGNVGHHQ